jgi:hypothetical protein
MSAAWEQRLRRAARREGLALHKATPCGSCWQLKDADGAYVHPEECEYPWAMHPVEVAQCLGVDLSDWVFPGQERYADRYAELQRTTPD